jgi:hypothetical protein
MPTHRITGADHYEHHKLNSAPPGARRPAGAALACGIKVKNHRISLYKILRFLNHEARAAVPDR